jgi:hypothetical protein
MKSFFLSLAIAACASTIAFAQNQAPPQGQGGGIRSQFMDACGNDMKTFCASAQSREDRRSCVMANKDKFSDSCKTFMASHPMHQHPQQGGGQ